MRLSTPLVLLTLALPIPAMAQDATDTTLPLTAEIRGTSETALQDTLYELVALKHKTHQMHWNIVGSDFYQLHEFYGEIYEGVDAFIDPTAERLRALGFPADARPSAVAENTSGVLAEAPTEEMEGMQTTEALLPAFEEFSARLYDRIDATEEDLPTQDFLIGIAYEIDKFTWQIRAHTK